MTSMIGRVFAASALFASLAIASPARAQSNPTYLYIAHAASGRNLSATANPALPVDVSANGVCLAKGESFGDILGPFTGPAYTYNFAVSMANSASPCSNPPVFTATAPLDAGTTYIGVITLNASNQVTGFLFPANFSAIAPGWSRVTVVNATDQNLTTTWQGSQTISPEIGAMSVQSGDVPSGMYSGSVTLTGSSTVQAGPENASLMSRDFYLYVLGGSAANGSLQILGPRVIPDVF